MPNAASARRRGPGRECRRTGRARYGWRMQSRARTRIVGVDTARGLAVLGMFVAHLGMERHTGFFTPTGWFFLGDGRPSALFAMLAGIGLVFMTRRAQDDPARFAYQRGRIIRRAVILY